VEKVGSMVDQERSVAAVAAPPREAVNAEGGPAPGLSPREREVLTLLGRGQTPKEVAFELGIAHSTVRVLRARAIKKMSLGRTGSA
jgi:DNA-binding CsgD family transcriptional regulator